MFKSGLVMVSLSNNGGFNRNVDKILRIAHKRFWTALLIISLLVYPVYYGLQIAAIGAVYKARLLCSNTFFVGRSPQQVLQNDLTGPEQFIFSSIDYVNQSVTAWFPGIQKQQSFYVENLGCIWAADIQENKLKTRARQWRVKPQSGSISSQQRPLKENFNHPAFDPLKLQQAVSNAFSDSGLNASAHTRALLIVYQDQLVSEQYAPNISKNTALQGWSMTKSVINALVGILIKQGKLSIEQKALTESWQSPDDPRFHITLDHLLRMSSGLEFNETTHPLVTDLTEMLFLRPDVAAFAINKPLQHAPGRHWAYSSGTTNIISHIIREASGGTTADTMTLLQNELFIPLRLQKALIEPDSRGNLIGSSYMYATARDWAKFGLLYLQDGLWEGKRILPKGWVKYSATPSPSAPKGKYGAHFWTNGGIQSTPRNRPFPSLPGDLFCAIGYKGQQVIIIPSQQMVIVHLGWSAGENDTLKRMETMVAEILNAKRG